jgi:hypothetical protein
LTNVVVRRILLRLHNTFYTKVPDELPDLPFPNVELPLQPSSQQAEPVLPPVLDVPNPSYDAGPAPSAKQPRVTNSMHPDTKQMSHDHPTRIHHDPQED